LKKKYTTRPQSDNEEAEYGRDKNNEITTKNIQRK
jgi:hypothetical protein